MKKDEIKGVWSDRWLDLVYKSVGIISAILLTIYTVYPDVKPRLLIILSFVYFMTVIFVIITNNSSKIRYLRFLSVLKQAGIKGVYHNRRANFARILDALSGELIDKIGTVNNIKILVNYGHDLLRSIEETLSTAIKDGAKVRIIIAKYDNEYQNDVWKLESYYSDLKNKNNHIPIEQVKRTGKNHYNSTLEIIDRLQKLSNEKDGNFRYKQFTTQARYAVVIVNKKWAWWTPYHPGMKVAKTTSFVLEKGKEHDDLTILGQCLGHYKALWDTLPSIEADQQGSKNTPNDTGASI
ncbi:MAG: hypothetical protein FWD47_15115 [Treponema sp.]|nr:hypothetical protein [Treponema sp.]